MEIKIEDIIKLMNEGKVTFNVTIELERPKEHEKPKPYLEKGRLNGIREIAKYLNISPSTAQKLKNEGKIPTYSIGRKVVAYEEEIKIFEKNFQK